MHHIVRYLKEFQDDYGIERIFTHTFSLKRELFNKLKMN